MAVSSPGRRAWGQSIRNLGLCAALILFFVNTLAEKGDHRDRHNVETLPAKERRLQGLGYIDSHFVENMGHSVVFLEVGQAHGGHQHHHKHKRTHKSAKNNKGRKRRNRAEHDPSNGRKRRKGKAKGKKAAKKGGKAKGGKKAGGGGGGGGGAMGGMAEGLAMGGAEAAGIPTSPEGLVGAAMGAPPGGQPGPAAEAAPGGAPGAPAGPSGAPVAEVISSPAPMPAAVVNEGGSGISMSVERELNELRREHDKSEIQLEMLKSSVNKVEDQLATTSNSLTLERRLQKLRGIQHLLQSRFDALNAAKTESADLRETMMKNAIAHPPASSAKPEMQLPEKIVINEPPHQQQQEQPAPMMGGGMYPGFYPRPGMYGPQMARPGMPYGGYYPNPMMMQSMMPNMKRKEGHRKQPKHKGIRAPGEHRPESVASKASIVPSKGHHAQKTGDMKEAVPKVHNHVHHKPMPKRNMRYYTNGDDQVDAEATNGIQQFSQDNGNFNGVEQIPMAEMDELTNGMPYNSMMQGNDGNMGYDESSYGMMAGDEQQTYAPDQMAFDEVPTNSQDYMERTGWIDEDKADEDDDQWAAEQAADGKDTADMDAYDPEQSDYDDVDAHGDPVDKDGNLLDGPSNEESEGFLQEDAETIPSDMASDDAIVPDRPSDTNGDDTSSEDDDYQDGSDPFADGMDSNGQLSESEDAVDNLEKEVDLQEKA